MQDVGIVLVLWATHFDEVATTVLATALRRAGIRVKLVGLQHGGAKGAGGLVLTADVTLEQAMQLADRACLIIIPASQGAVERLNNDPLFPQRREAVVEVFSSPSSSSTISPNDSVILA